MREIRFRPLASDDPAWERHAAVNTWAGWPDAATICPWLALRATVRGEPDPVTGYLVNISEIDRVLREAARRCGDLTGLDAVEALQRLWREVGAAWPLAAPLERLTLVVSPYCRYSLGAEDGAMVKLTRSYEFSAAHRLYSPELSDEENRRVFGKCANANGHGHNYQVEVTVRVPMRETGEAPGRRLDEVVREVVVERFDHKHLNADCADFATLNPTVENIARVVWELLRPRLAGIELDRVRVWETPKTRAEYRGS